MRRGKAISNRLAYPAWGLSYFPACMGRKYDNPMNDQAARRSGVGINISRTGND